MRTKRILLWLIKGTLFLISNYCLLYTLSLHKYLTQSDVNYTDKVSNGHRNIMDGSFTGYSNVAMGYLRKKLEFSNEKQDPKPTDSSTDASQNSSDCVDGKYYSFERLNEDSYVHSFQWLCVFTRKEHKYNISKIGESRKWYLGDKEIQLPRKICKMIPPKYLALYRAKKDSLKYFKLFEFKLRSGGNGVPRGYTVAKETAYFLGENKLPFAVENLYHFMKQMFFPLYFMIKSTGRLGPGNRNVVLYGQPLGRCPGRFVRYSLDYAKPFYEMLNIRDPYTSAFEDLPNPNKVCYKTAVVSKSLHLNHAYEALEFVKDKFGVSSSSCKSRTAAKTVIFVGRKVYRKILNLEELVETAKSLGYDATVVHFETMSFAEQLQLIHCTDILVGVTGAGLQWAYFMRNHSGVVEIAWPQFEWPFFFSNVHRNQSTSHYSDLNGIRPLRFATVEAEKCHLNPDAINIYHKAMFSVESNFTREESLQLLQNPKNYDFARDPLTNLGKLCDVTVDPNKLKKAFERLDSC